MDKLRKVVGEGWTPCAIGMVEDDARKLLALIEAVEEAETIEWAASSADGDKKIAVTRALRAVTEEEITG